MFRFRWGARSGGLIVTVWLTACSTGTIDGPAGTGGTGVATGGTGGSGGSGASGGSGGTGATTGGAAGQDAGSVCQPGEKRSCYPGPPGTDGVGLCVAGVETCNASGSGFDPCQGYTAPVPETCATPGDDDCNGLANEGGADCTCTPGSQADCYSAPQSTKGVGPCVGGKQTCNANGVGYGICQGEVVPVAETCNTSVDDDCDGALNEEGSGCVCVPSSIAPCYSGPAGTEGVGACKAGSKTCNAQGTAYGSCSGHVLPATEVCTTALDEDCNGKLNDGCVYKSCLELGQFVPGAATGEYAIDTDGSGPMPQVQARCDMTTDGGGYTMVRFADSALGTLQAPYAAKCAAVGMEVLVTRTKPHAQSVYTWNNGEPANLVNVFPKYAGASGINQWQAICKGVACTFWMTDDASGDVGCSNFEPNGDNDTAYRIYRRTTGCGIQGDWNDASDSVQITGWVVCSTNDK